MHNMAGATLLLLHRRVLHSGICSGVSVTFDTHLALGRTQEIIGSLRSLMWSVTFETVTCTSFRMMHSTLSNIGMTSET